jgi:hydrogenase nickel incorporation protein HypA/HybF
MHEASIVGHLIEAIGSGVDSGRIQGRIRAVHLRVGKLTSVVPDSLEFFFEAMKADTPLADSRLLIEEMPVRCTCRSCGSTFEVNGPQFGCDSCHSQGVDVVGGRELVIEAVEVEE